MLCTISSVSSALENNENSKIQSCIDTHPRNHTLYIYIYIYIYINRERKIERKIEKEREIAINIDS